MATLLLASWAQADDYHEFAFRIYEQQFFSTPVNERSLGMGGAFAGMRGTAASVTENPAGLVFLEGPDMSMFYSYGTMDGEDQPGADADADLHQGGVFFGTPVYPWCGAFAIGGSVLDGDTDGPGDLSQSGGRLHLGLGFPVAPNLSFGYSLSYFDDELKAGGLEKHEADYFLHRVGLHGDCGPGLRWGMVADYGHGDDDNYYGGINYGGDDSLEYYGGRVGFEMDMSPQLSFGVDFDWHRNEVDFGQPFANAGYSLKGKTETFRPMIGIEQRLSDVFALRYGYRYNYVDMKSEPTYNDDFDYHTITGGVGMLMCNYRMELGWGIEYSWVGDGELTNKIALNYKF